METDTFKIIFICLVISIIVSVLTVLVYDVGLTPANQQKEIDYINKYLKEMIIGYSP